MPGIGKTSLAAEFPDPIFIQTEEGAGNLELTTFADGPLTSAAEVDEAIELLLTGDHKFRTVVVDSLDWLEPIIWARPAVATAPTRWSSRPSRTSATARAT